METKMENIPETIKAKEVKGNCPQQVTLLQEPCKVTICVLLLFAFLVNVLAYHVVDPKILKEKNTPPTLSGIFWIATFVIDILIAATSILFFVTALLPFEDWPFGNKWHIDFTSSIIFQSSWKKTTFIRFDDINQITEFWAPLPRTKFLSLRCKTGQCMLIGPIVLPCGLMDRLLKSTKPLFPQTGLEKKCCLPADASLVSILTEMAKVHKQKSIFWEEKNWWAKELEATAYYQLEDSTLWTLRYIQQEHDLEGEWKFEKVGGSVSIADWNKVLK